MTRKQWMVVTLVIVMLFISGCNSNQDKELSSETVTMAVKNDETEMYEVSNVAKNIEQGKKKRGIPKPY